MFQKIIKYPLSFFEAFKFLSYVTYVCLECTITVCEKTARSKHAEL
jgi:hypothetical protein